LGKVKIASMHLIGDVKGQDIKLFSKTYNNIQDKKS